MLEWFGNIVVVLLGLIGVTELVRLIVFWMLSPGRGEKMLIVVPVTGHDEEAEFVLRSAAQRAKWMGGKDEKRVLCVDCGMDEETRRICETICREYRFMEIVAPEELENYFRLQGE
jgi:hypothetical protein